MGVMLQAYIKIFLLEFKSLILVARSGFFMTVEIAGFNFVPTGNS